MIKRLVIVLGISLLALSCLGQKEYPSLLWEISKPDISKPSYLYGTMHVSSKVAFSLSDSFFEALESADVIALESDPSEWMDQMEQGDMLNRNFDWDFTNQNYGDFYSRAFTVNIPSAKDYGEMLRFEPSIVNGLLYRFNGAEADFEEDTYLDLFIYQAGKKMKKEVMSLEDFQDVQSLSEKATAAAKIEPEKPSPFGYDENPYELIENAYRNGDLNTLDSIMHLLNSKSFIQYMLVQRNEQMSVKMDSVISSGNSLFSGVGAAHLAGKEGVIEMLRAKGYTLKPILKDLTAKSLKIKNKIEAKSIDLELDYQYPTDSTFRVKLPGKLYELPMSSGKQTYIHPEMIHGINYSVVRLKTFNAITGSTPEKIVLSIDSLLFENIPGDIISKKSIQINNHPGFDIINKTRRGDYQRYQIIALPSELLIFKVKGPKKTAVCSDAKTFFESIEFLTPENTNWETFTSASNEFSVLLPQKLKKSSAISEAGFLSLQINDPSSEDYYILQRNILHDYKYIEEDEFELTYLIENLAERSGFKLKDIDFKSDGKHPTVESILISKTGTKIYAHALLNGGNYYLLMHVSSSGVKNQEFFDSFTLNKLTYPDFESYTDSAMMFSVVTPVRPVVPEVFHSGGADIYGDENSEDIDYSHLPSSDSRVFFNDETGEKIVIDYYKYHYYRSEKDEQAYWCKRFSSSWNYEDMKISEIDSGFVNSYPFREFSYTNSGSSREINVRVLLKNSTKYSIYYLSDSLDTRSEFVTTFMESFQPLDSIYTTSFFLNKADLFFDDLWSADSLVERKALSSLSEIRFADSNAEDITHVIEKYKNDEFSSYEKAFLIEELGYLKHNCIIPYLKAKYRAVDDTSSYQLAILKALGRMRTKAATLLFKELLIEETPLSRVRDINPIFIEYKDSLELAQFLFPEILELSSFDEYQASIFQLLARLKDKGLINSEEYKHKLKEITWEARNTLKRKLASEEENGDNSYGDYLSDDYLSGSFYYKPSSPERKFYNDPLAVYTSLLNDFREDHNVQSFFLKREKISDESVLFSLKAMDVILGETLTQEYADLFCESNKTRNSLYELSLSYDIDLSKSCLNQQSLAEGILFKNACPKDSVTFIDKKWIAVKDTSGFVYFFKSLNSYNQEWQVSCYGLFNKDEEDLTTSDSLRGNKIKIRGATQEEKLLEILADFKLHERQRADKKSKGGFNDYYLYD